MSEEIKKEAEELSDGDLRRVAGGIGVWMICKKNVLAYNPLQAKDLNQCSKFQAGHGLSTAEHRCINCNWFVPKS